MEKLDYFFFSGCSSIFQPCRYCRHPRNKPAGGCSTKLIILKGWFGLSASKMHRWELSSDFLSSLKAETPAAASGLPAAPGTSAMGGAEMETHRPICHQNGGEQGLSHLQVIQSCPRSLALSLDTERSLPGKEQLCPSPGLEATPNPRQQQAGCSEPRAAFFPWGFSPGIAGPLCKHMLPPISAFRDGKL